MSTSSDPITLTRHVLAEQRKHKEAQGDLTILLSSIQLACKAISSAVRKAGISNLYGLAGSTNVQGEEVKKLDLLANENFINALSFSEKVCLMASEENEEPVTVSGHLCGKYSCVFDPLDGSSNIDAAVPVGSIFGIYKQVDEKGQDVKNVLQPGKKLVAAGYSMYGSSTMMVISTGNGVNGFTLDPSIGEFILTHPNIRIPKQGKIYSCNEGNATSWDEPTQKYIQVKKNPPDGGKPYSLRYVGSMVADVHRTLLYGGIFMYPADKKSPNGKLRLLYECNPMAFLVEQAGGKASTGKQDILSLEPEKVHQRCPCILGSPEDVDEILSYYK
eukprot:gb/GECH01011704.1/.p1 GENE.gb/GECH01011704.1/~~gb/GECH01011704.1/.p1  ORF type:complete len:331 (+),score=82.99 gb/GECH01011704.1/:1-993(+)